MHLLHGAALFKLWSLSSVAKHWCHVVPLSRMALISALSWGRLIPTVLTLSPVLHCDTGYRRNSQHPHFSKLKHHLWCYWIPIVEPKNIYECWSQLYISKLHSHTHCNNAVSRKHSQSIPSRRICLNTSLIRRVHLIQDVINCSLCGLSW